MNLNIPLSREAEAKLRHEADAVGMDVNTFVLEVLNRTILGKSTEERGSIDTESDDPFLGLLSHDPELADYICDSAMQARETRPLRNDRG